ncbi:MAG: ABC transporter permease [Nitrososphaeria archaeon]
MVDTRRIGKILTFANMNLRWIRSYPQVSIPYLLIAPFFFFLIAILISKTVDLRSLIVPVVSVSVSNSILICRDFWEDKKSGLLLHYMLSMQPIDYILGYMLSRLVLTFIAFLIIFVISSMLLGIEIMFEFVYIVIPMIEIWLFCSVLGFLIGVKSKEMRSASMTGELSWLILLATSTTFYDSVIIPFPFRCLLLLNPITFATEAMKSSFGFTTLVGFTEGCAILSILIALLFVSLFRSFRWRM